MMWPRIAKAVGLSNDAQQRDPLLDYLANRQAILILDNLEQVPDAAPVVAELLTRAPRWAIVATSRRPLHIEGEREYLVPRLTVSPHTTLHATRQSSAVDLFVRRARLVSPGFLLTERNAADVATICRRVDGLPLAIELAASRCRVLSPSALLARLDKTSDLEATEIDRPSRHRSIRETIAWSYDLLSPVMQKFFRQLGVFSGGCELDAIAAVLDGEHDPLVATTTLFDMSLCTVIEQPDGEPRVDMLETIHEFALERLDLEHDREETRLRHARHFLQLAQECAPQLWTGRQLDARDRLEAEQDNIRVALRWLLQPDGQRPAPDQAQMGLQLASSCWWFWLRHGYVAEGCRWLERATLVTEDEGPDMAAALTGLAALTAWSANRDVDRQVELLQRAAEISRQCNDLGGASHALSLLSMNQYFDDPPKARALLERSASLARVADDNVRLSLSLEFLSSVELEQGNLDRSLALKLEARSLALERGDERHVLWTDIGTADVLRGAGRHPEAHDQLRAIVPAVLRLRDPSLTFLFLVSFAEVLAALGDDERAVRLLGAHWNLAEKFGLPVDGPDEEAWLEKSPLAKARSEVGAEVWDKSLRIGATYSAEEAAADALQASEFLT